LMSSRIRLRKALPAILLNSYFIFFYMEVHMHGKGVGWGCPVCVNCIIIIVPPEKRDGGGF
jgi:hypothetical protein